MENDFHNLHPFKFIDKYTLELQKLNNDKNIALKIVELCQASIPHLTVFKMLSDPYRNRIRKAIYQSNRKEYDRFSQHIERVECDTCVCPQDLQIGDQCMIAEPIFNDNERDVFMKRVQPYAFHMYLGAKKKQLMLHVWTIFQENVRSKFALFMHGFGMDCTKHDWMKWCFPLFQRNFNILMVDFPGFGRSSGRDVQSISWKPNSNQMIFRILNHFGAKKNITVFADCGGAAAFCKMLVARPKIFCKRHVLIRPTMGRWQNIEGNMKKFGIKLWVTWIVDGNHPIHHASQKNWERVKKEYPNHLNYVVQKKGYDINRITYYQTQYTPNVSRTKDSFSLFSFHDNYFKKILVWFDSGFKKGKKKKKRK